MTENKKHKIDKGFRQIFVFFHVPAISILLATIWLNNIQNEKWIPLCKEEDLLEILMEEGLNDSQI